MIIPTTDCLFSSLFVQDSSASREIPTSTDCTVCTLHHPQLTCVFELNCSSKILIHDQSGGSLGGMYGRPAPMPFNAPISGINWLRDDTALFGNTYSQSLHSHLITASPQVRTLPDALPCHYWPLASNHFHQNAVEPFPPCCCQFTPSNGMRVLFSWIFWSWSILSVRKIDGQNSGVPKPKAGTNLVVQLIYLSYSDNSEPHLRKIELRLTECYEYGPAVTV